MNIPILLFGIVLSTLYGALYHFWKGGSIKRLLLMIGLSWMGFWVGHFIGGLANITFGMVGTLNAGMASLGSLVFLVAGEWLSLVEVQKKK
jgi:hypothetical protein